MNEPLLLLPGHMCDARLFSRQIDGLCGLATLHLPRAPRENSIESMAVETLDAAPPRFAVAGISMGGIIAMELIRIAPERIAGIALMDTNHLPESEATRAERQARMDRAAAGHLREVMRDDLKPLYLAKGADLGSVRDLVMDMALSLGPDVFIDQSRALIGRRDQSDTLRSINVPALVMCGEMDMLCPEERHREIAALIPNARLEVIPGAGHLPNLEQSELTNQKLIEWMEIKT